MRYHLVQYDTLSLAARANGERLTEHNTVHEVAYLIHNDGDGPLAWHLDCFEMERRGLENEYRRLHPRVRLYPHNHPDYYAKRGRNYGE